MASTSPPIMVYEVSSAEAVAGTLEEDEDEAMLSVLKGSNMYELCLTDRQPDVAYFDGKSAYTIHGKRVAKVRHLLEKAAERACHVMRISVCTDQV